MRLIDTDELLGRVERAIKNSNRDRGYLILGSFVKEMLANCPTVDAEPVRHGHWTPAGYCSVCDGEQLGRTDEYGEALKTARCPHCGAKMDEEDKE